MNLIPSHLAGAGILELPHSFDNRGSFTKTFNTPALENIGINFDLKESYFSFSSKDVIRGMHFQLPPHDHAKIVFCPLGSILDVIVDLRKDSPTYGQCDAEVLSGDNFKAMYIPKGFAHGFKALTDGAMTYYLVSSAYHKDSDTGILYNSIGLDWDVAKPIMSDRDKGFIELKDFSSPF